MRQVVLGGGVTLDELATPEAQRTTLTVSGFATTLVSSDVHGALEFEHLSMSPPPLPESAGRPDELEVKGLLGAGGTGRVLLARQVSLERDVAVKVLKNPGPGSGAVLVTEARLTGGLEHPGIVPVHALASDEHGHPALVMKRVDGVSWRELIDQADHPMWSRLPPAPERLDAHLAIFLQVCNAIAFAHRRGVLHRDVKPANVLIGEFGEVYVADWGIAMRKGAPQPACLVGTPAYLAPEMVAGDAALLSERTDVFLLGAVLYELLAGAPPWRAPNLHALLEQVSAGTPPPLPPSAPAGLRAVCTKAMRHRPEARYASALELRDAVTQTLRHRSSVAITTATEARLDALSAAIAQGRAAADLYPLLSECRFGFTQALREWPENEDASRGLARALEAGVRFEVSRNHGAAARALLSELKQPPADLEALVRATEEREARLADEAARFSTVARQLDPRRARRPRAVVLGVLAVAMGVYSASRVLAPQLWAHEWATVFASASFLAIFLSAMVATRKLVLSTRVNRQLALFLSMLLVSQLVHRVIGVAFGKPTGQLLTEELVVLGACAAVGGVAFHWSFYVGAGLLWVSSVVAAAQPHLAERLFTLGSITTILLVGGLSLRYWRSEFAGDASGRG